MFYRYLHISYFLYLSFNIQSVITYNHRFICPKDGRWPHPSDCEKYFTCNSGSSIEVWCGHGMTYDIDNGRCDLSKNIDCKNGERPNWLPPDGWQTPSVTFSIPTKTTSIISNDPITAEKKRRTTIKLITTKMVHSRILFPSNILMENSPCTFQGNIPDQDNCQSYFTCKDDTIIRVQCLDKHLFDEDLRSCNDYRKVFCANRPTNEHGNDPCVGRPNGWYADSEKQCRLYYLCTEQRKTKMGECPIGSKWNPHRLRCDDPRYIASPCGLRSNTNTSSLDYHQYYSTVLIVFSFMLLTI